MENGVPLGSGNKNDDRFRARGAIVQWSPVVVNLAISVPLARALNILLDESYTLHTTGGGIRYAWTQALRFELQPPLFFTLLSIWRVLDQSILFARIFSVICAAVTVYLSLGLARRYAPRVSPLLVGLVCAVHPFVIWSAVNIRVYAFALLLSALLLLFFYDGFLAEKGKSWSRWAYLIVAVLALYTQYYLGFMLLANAIVLVVQRRWTPLRSYILGMCGVGVLFLPMVPEVYRQFFAHTKDIAGHDSFPTSLNDFSWIVKGHIFPADADRLESVRRWLQLIGIPALAVAGLIRWREFRKTGVLPIWVVFVILLPIFLLLRYRIGYDFFSAKHTSALFFPALLSVWALIRIVAGRWGSMIWGALVLVACIVSLTAIYRPMAKVGDWRRAADYVAAHEANGEPILFFSPTGAEPFGYYYHGPNRLVPLPKPESYDTYDIERYVLHSDQEITDALGAGPGTNQRIWVVTDSFCRLQAVDFNCPLLENYLNRYYEVESEQEFYGSRVRLLRLRVPATK
jgi:hypothetical protein